MEFSILTIPEGMIKLYKLVIIVAIFDIQIITSTKNYLKN